MVAVAALQLSPNKLQLQLRCGRCVRVWACAVAVSAAGKLLRTARTAVPYVVSDVGGDLLKPVVFRPVCDLVIYLVSEMLDRGCGVHQTGGRRVQKYL